MIESYPKHRALRDIGCSYQQLPSFVVRLPWRDYSDQHKCILLEDNLSISACFKITPISCESRPEAMLDEIAKSIGEAIKNAIPCEKENPWILQVYANKQSDLSGTYNDIENNFSEGRKQTPVIQAYLNHIKEHLEYVSSSDGVFHDSQVTNQKFKGGLLNVYAVLYRRNKANNISRHSRLTE